ncbi:hypothetical protein DV737_g3878, partial [Chaetothyriales sp. CBS 132003]
MTSTLRRSALGFNRSGFSLIDPETELYHHKIGRAQHVAISYVWSDWTDDPEAGHHLRHWPDLRRRLLKIVGSGASTFMKICSGHATSCWLDCKCIDQESATDKAYWVPRMDEIYSEARCQWRKRAWIFQEILLSEEYILTDESGGEIKLSDVGVIASLLFQKYSDEEWLSEFANWYVIEPVVNEPILSRICKVLQIPTKKAGSSVVMKLLALHDWDALRERGQEEGAEDGVQAGLDYELVVSSARSLQYHVAKAQQSFDFITWTSFDKQHTEYHALGAKGSLGAGNDVLIVRHYPLLMAVARDEAGASASSADKLYTWKTVLHQPANLPSSADVVIVGSGISGASIAYNLLVEEPETKIVLLEARQAASGASGRNGGHTKTATYRTFLDNVARAGEDDAVKIGRLEYNCMRAVHDFIAEHGIAADSVRCDSVDVFYDEAEFQRAQKSVALMHKLMGTSDPAAAYYFVDAAETAAKYLCANAVGSVKYEAGSLNAYKLTIGILKLALAKGLNLQCNTPALSIAQDDTARWTVTTDRGNITTARLVLATNAYTAHLLPELQGTVVPLRGVVTAQRPGLNLPQHGLPTTYSMVYNDGYEYMITRPAGVDFSGDVVIGGGRMKAGRGRNGEEELGNTDDSVVPAEIESYLVACTEAYFGADNWGRDHAEGRVRAVWTGIMAISADGFPLVGPVPAKAGLFVDAGFQGHGMVFCLLCSRACTAMILGREHAASLDEWFPTCYRVTAERMQKKFVGPLGG